MTGLKIVLTIVDIILAIAIIILFLVQEGNDQGMGVVAGGSTESSSAMLFSPPTRYRSASPLTPPVSAGRLVLTARTFAA